MCALAHEQAETHAIEAGRREVLLDANKAGILVGGVVDDALPQLCIHMAAIMLCPHLQKY